MKIVDFDIHDIINEAIKKKDRCVYIFFGKEGTSVTIEPLEKDISEDNSDNGQAYCSHCGAKMRGAKES